MENVREYVRYYSLLFLIGDVLSFLKVVFVREFSSVLVSKGYSVRFWKFYTIGRGKGVGRLFRFRFIFIFFIGFFTGFGFSVFFFGEKN